MKKYITIVIAFLVAFSLSAQTQTFVKRQADSLQTYHGPRVGVVLAGGGAKGAAHIGVLKYIEEMGIPVSYVTGTSMGSIIGGLYALGYEPTELADIIASADWTRLMSNSIERRCHSNEQRFYSDRELLSVPFGFGDMSYARQNIMNSLPAAIINSSNIQNLFSRLSVGYTDSMDFNQLPIPFACVAIDIITGDSVVLHSGSFPLAIRSSMAIPGIFSPVKWGKYLLADGGLVNNFPVDVCKNMGADIIIGVELASDLASSADELRSLPQMLSQYMALGTKGDRFEHRKMCDVYIHPDVTGYNMLSFSAESIDSLVSRGYREAAVHHDALQAIHDRLAQYGHTGKSLQAPHAIKLLEGDSIQLRHVNYHGVIEGEMQQLRSTNNFVRKGISTVDDIETFVSSMRGTGYYNYVLYTMRPTGAEDVYDLDVYLTPSKPHRLGVGFRFDTEESASILFHFGYNELRLNGFKALFDIDLTYNFALDLRLLWSTGLWGDFNFDYNLSQSKFAVRNSTAASYSAVQQRVRLYYSYNNIQGFTFNLGGMAQTVVDADYVRYRNLFALDNSFSRINSFGLFASLLYDNRDDAYFPTRGIAMGIEGELRYLYVKPPSENIYDENDILIEEKEYPYKVQYPACKSLRAYIKPTIGIGSRFAVLPSVGGRVFFDLDYNVNMPYHDNIFGGVFDRRYVDHQFAFIGTTGPMLANDLMAIGRIDLRYRFGKNLYLSAIVNVLYTKSIGEHESNLMESWPSEDDPVWELSYESGETIKPNTEFWIRGLGLEVAYKSMIGPISFDLMWNDVTKRFGGYLNIGYFF